MRRVSKLAFLGAHHRAIPPTCKRRFASGPEDVRWRAREGLATQVDPGGSRSTRGRHDAGRPERGSKSGRNARMQRARTGGLVSAAHGSCSAQRLPCRMLPSAARAAHGPSSRPRATPLPRCPPSGRSPGLRLFRGRPRTPRRPRSRCPPRRHEPRPRSGLRPPLPRLRLARPADAGSCWAWWPAPSSPWSREARARRRSTICASGARGRCARWSTDTSGGHSPTRRPSSPCSPRPLPSCRPPTRARLRAR